MSDDALRSPAWLLVGMTRSVPGLLELADGRLAFTIEEGPVFDAPLSGVSDIKFPWYYFGGGVKLRIGNERYRLSFVRPNDAADISGRFFARIGGAAGAAAGLSTAWGKFVDVGIGRKAGKAWKSALVTGNPYRIIGS